MSYYRLNSQAQPSQAKEDSVFFAELHYCVRYLWSYSAIVVLLCNQSIHITRAAVDIFSLVVLT